MTAADILISPELIEAIKSFPVQRKIKHCGAGFAVSPFDIYAVCPVCETEMKVRSSTGGSELEDVFDAFFEWMTNPRAKECLRKRQKEIIEDVELV